MFQLSPKTDQVAAVNAEFPEALQILFQPSRYKVLYGGRGAAKSWGIARALLILAAKQKLRILCARELQNSIAESVHKLLSDQISNLGLSSEYIIEKASIRSRVGSEFFFEGIRQNTDKIKSYEGIDICWVEEANKVLKSSWDILIPTIRKDPTMIWGKPYPSEIWISFNPELATDDTYDRFVTHADILPNALVRKISWRDNPWFSTIMRAEMEALKAKDPDAYLNVWEGNCRIVLDGAVYADELRDVSLENRVTKVPYDPQFPVSTFWDLGRSDYTAIWFAQRVGFEIRIVDFYQNNKKGLDHYLGVLQNKKYIYGTDWLPFDAKAKTLGSKMSIEEQVRGKGRKVRIVPRLSMIDGINAVRTIFPICWFDEKNCSEGLQCLRHYRYDEKDGVLSKNPIHDENSHGADAFRYLSIAIKYPQHSGPLKDLVNAAKSKFNPDNIPPITGGWMR